MLLKKTSLTILLALFTLCSCTDQEKENLQPQHVEFSFDARSAAIDGRVSTENLPDSVAIVITLANSAGTEVFKYRRINLWRLNGAFIAESIELAPGSYSVKDFLLVDGSSNILFATPLKDAPFAKLVSRSLPYSFTVSASKTNSVKMEVVDASMAQPEDFGYVSFNVNFTHPLKITVFRTVLGQPKITNAKAYVYDGDVLKASYTMAMKPNVVAFKLDPEKTYKLVIKKDGFRDYEQMFTYNDLIASYGTKGLEVTMTSLTSFRIITDKSFRIHWGNQFMLSFVSKASVTVDWGHGDVDTINYSGIPDVSNNRNVFYLYREFNPVQDTVYVRGDLDLISRFDCSNALLSVNPEVLPSLAIVGIEYNIPALDLSGNAKLTYLSFVGMNINSLILPERSNLRYINIQSQSEELEWHNNETLRYIINNYYSNAIARKIKGGYFRAFYTDMVITPDSQAKLDYLQNNLGWVLETYFPEE